jgi:hypothetical protein
VIKGVIAGHYCWALLRGVRYCGALLRDVIAGHYKAPNSRVPLKLFSEPFWGNLKGYFLYFFCTFYAILCYCTKVDYSGERLTCVQDFETHFRIMILVKRLGSVAGPVIQATGRSEFEDGLGSGDFVSGYSYYMSVRTRLSDHTKQTKFQSQPVPSISSTEVPQHRDSQYLDG